MRWSGEALESETFMNRLEESEAVNPLDIGGMMSQVEETANAKALTWWLGLYQEAQ